MKYVIVRYYGSERQMNQTFHFYNNHPQVYQKKKKSSVNVYLKYLVLRSNNATDIIYQTNIL